MTWIAYSLLMFISSIVWYSVIRKLKRQSSIIMNFWMFMVPTFITGIYLVINRIPFEIDSFLTLVALMSLPFFAGIGNYYSIKALEKTLNPGFSLVLQKAYASFTIFLSVLLFGSELTTMKLLGACIVIIFTLIMGSGVKKLFSKDNIWFVHTLIAYFAFGMISIVSKYLFLKGFHPFAITFVLAMGTVITMLTLSKVRQINLLVKKDIILWLVGAGILCFLFNVFQYTAISVAPNVGYVNTINAASVAALTIVSAIIFKDKLTRVKLMCVVGVFVGLILIFI